MPRGDGTGPAGVGPMTGRASGYCAGYNTPGYMNAYGGRFAGRGFRGGFGGRGYRNRYYATGLPGWSRYDAGYPEWGGVARNPYVSDVDPEQEKEILRRESEALQVQLDEIKTRMEELSGEEKKKK